MSSGSSTRPAHGGDALTGQDGAVDHPVDRAASRNFLGTLGGIAGSMAQGRVGFCALKLYFGEMRGVAHTHGQFDNVEHG
jgi:hypothetical protein